MILAVECHFVYYLYVHSDNGYYSCNPSVSVSLCFSSSLSDIILIIFTTSFPSKYIRTLSGVMWIITGMFTFFQYAILGLTDDVSKSWRVCSLSLFILFEHDQRRYTVFYSRLGLFYQALQY